MEGIVNEPIQFPTRFGAETWKKSPIVKIISGANHNVALTKDKKVYAWGAADDGKIGRNLRTRDKNNQALKIEAVGAKDAVDIFCGHNHSFYMNSKGHLFAWGKNSYGQLGVGTTL
jgi:alpha-tubulin suppressor-like RCC1 family protein